jgi:hypothetical protein
MQLVDRDDALRDRSGWTISGGMMVDATGCGQMTIQDLRDLDTRIPQGLAGNPQGLRTTVRCFGVMKRFFGDEWLRAHVVTAQPTDYLGLDFTSDQAREEKTWRIIELAEMLFNLQSVSGFRSCIVQMQRGQIEDTYAELETGKWLQVHEVPFRFNMPTGVKGEDYDLDIIYPDVTACADTKCKFETTEVSPSSIRDSLEQARSQLPKDRPGIIFVKMPAHWLETPPSVASFVREAEGFLRNTGRVVSVKFYSPMRVITGGMVASLMRFREVSNLNHRHKAARADWDIFAKHAARYGVKPLPSTWVTMLGEYSMAGFPRLVATPGEITTEC